MHGQLNVKKKKINKREIRTYIVPFSKTWKILTNSQNIKQFKM